MQNIELKMHKPYQREPAPNLPYKVEFSAEFADIAQALNFMMDLNRQVIHFNDHGSQKPFGIQEFMELK